MELLNKTIKLLGVMAEKLVDLTNAEKLRVAKNEMAEQKMDVAQGSVLDPLEYLLHVNSLKFVKLK